MLADVRFLNPVRALHFCWGQTYNPVQVNLWETRLLPVGRMSESLRGQYLIAGRALRDQNFFKTVVLIVEHGPQQAMGLVINRPSSVTVAHALSEHFKLPETEDLVFVGGPVEPSNLFIVHNAGDLDENESPVVPDVYVGSSPGVFERVVGSSQSNPDLRFRIFCGCAGWGPQQLEQELERGDWHLHEADCKSVFHENPYEVWELLLEQLSSANTFLPSARPQRPEWN